MSSYGLVGESRNAHSAGNAGMQPATHTGDSTPRPLKKRTLLRVDVFKSHFVHFATSLFLVVLLLMKDFRRFRWQIVGAFLSRNRCAVEFKALVEVILCCDTARVIHIFGVFLFDSSLSVLLHRLQLLRSLLILLLFSLLLEFVSLKLQLGPVLFGKGNTEIVGEGQ